VFGISQAPVAVHTVYLLRIPSVRQALLRLLKKRRLDRGVEISRVRTSLLRSPAIL
jgi:hypothetical protein